MYIVYIYKFCFSKTVPHQDWNRLLLVYAVYGLRALEALKRKSSYIVSWQRQWDNDWSTKDPLNPVVANLSSLETKSLQGHLGAKGGLQDHRSNERERERQRPNIIKTHKKKSAFDGVFFWLVPYVHATKSSPITNRVVKLKVNCPDLNERTGCFFHGFVLP